MNEPPHLSHTKDKQIFLVTIATLNLPRNHFVKVTAQFVSTG